MISEHSQHMLFQKDRPVDLIRDKKVLHQKRHSETHLLQDMSGQDLVVVGQIAAEVSFKYFDYFIDVGGMSTNI